MITKATKNISDMMETTVAQERTGIRLLTPEEVASLFSVDKRTVLKWARDGKLGRKKMTGKIIRFTTESVNLFLKSKDQGVESINPRNSQLRVRAKKSIPKKGGFSKTSRKSSWRSLRKEAAQWL